MEKGPTTLGYQLAQLADDSSKWHTAKHTAHREGRDRLGSRAFRACRVDQGREAGLGLT